MAKYINNILSEDENARSYVIKNESLNSMYYALSSVYQQTNQFGYFPLCSLVFGRSL